MRTVLTRPICASRLTQVAPERAQEARPFRLAVIQLGTYDGTVYNARKVIDKHRPPLRLHPV